MLSWKRPLTVKKLIEQYLDLDIIDEILIMNNNPLLDLREYLDPEEQKTTIIQSTRDLGLYSRFTTAALATNDCILFVDDDILIPHATISALFHEWEQNPLSCHGIFGRSGSRQYSPVDRFGQVKIILTRCCMAHKDVALQALHMVKSFKELRSVPKGNGEDIILSYAAMTLSKKFNFSYSLPHEDLENKAEKSDGEAISIHKRWPMHYEHRTRVIEICEAITGGRQLQEPSSPRMLLSWFKPSFSEGGI